MVPADNLTVFSDGDGAGWTCADAEGSTDVASAEHVRAGAASLRVDDEVTCTHAGEPLHPFSRTLDLWAFSPTGASALRVQDAHLDSGGLLAGRWVHLSLPAESLNAHPDSWVNGGPDDPQPTLVTQLGFSTDAPVWLDEVRLLGAVAGDADVPTAVAATPPQPQPADLHAAYPNPFNASTVIPFRIERPGSTRLIVFTVLGQRVRTLVDAELAAGEHLVTWNGRDDEGRGLGTGLYLCRLSAGGHPAAVAKVLILR